MTENPRWQVLAAQDITKEEHPYLRMSAAGKCARALAYALQSTPESDPPDANSRNRMNLGHMAEILIVQNLEAAGWETDHTVLSDSGQLEVTMEIPDTGYVLTGHPDGTCRHPHFTKDKWVPLECKSMSPDRADETIEHGIATTYPSYMAQIGLYGRQLHERELVSHPTFGVFAMMDRNGRTMAPERVSWEESFVDTIITKVQGVIQQSEKGELPERPYPPGSQECTFCPYHTLCRGEPARIDQGISPTPAVSPKDPEVTAAARLWRDLKPQNDYVKSVLQAACDEADNANIVFEDVIAGYFVPRNPPEYLASKLEKLVPADILAKCKNISLPKGKGFWIRKAKY